MPLLSGEYSATLDEKNRVNIPARFREGIPDNTLVLTRGMMERCIWALTPENWEKLANNLKSAVSLSMKKTDMVHHRLLFSTFEAEIDKIGRIALPQKLKDWAALSKDVVITSDGIRIEIWDKQRHAEYEEASDEQFDNILEEIGPIALY
jgi:MraZ protein